jgi:hypothetical protein
MVTRLQKIAGQMNLKTKAALAVWRGCLIHRSMPATLNMMPSIASLES